MLQALRMECVIVLARIPTTESFNSRHLFFAKSSSESRCFTFEMIFLTHLNINLCFDAAETGRPSI